MFAELGVFPLICGWFLGLCSLDVFASSLHDRLNFLTRSPITAAFLHWIVGMTFMFHFASLVAVLRTMLRPGVLWFLRNPEDPNFHPLREMVEVSLVKHFRRFFMSAVLYSIIVVLIFYVNTKAVSLAFPRFYPMNWFLS